MSDNSFKLSNSEAIIIYDKNNLYQAFLSSEQITDLKNEEVSLIKKIDSFPEIIEKSYKTLSPNLIATYSFDLSKTFNEFYHNCQVIGGVEEGFRLALVNAFKVTLKKSLYLLGIETLEEM